MTSVGAHFLEYIEIILISSENLIPMELGGG